ncbi:T3SS secreted effector EspN-like protein [Salmonella enterica subsp. diarizonae]|nr:T3SS secreted effector EspN-like protein [Salmonella enterica subsp. diarizonae]
MPVTLEHVSSRTVQQKLNTKGIRTWDTIQYLSALDGAHKDTVFHEQISNLPEEYIHLDEMARDEKEYSLNIYEFFFESTSEIICEDIKSTLDFYYLNSPTFRRLVNYRVDYSINNDIDTSKCEVIVSPNYSYENAEGSRVYLSLPFNKKGFPIDPESNDCDNNISSEKVLLDLFLKHILYDDLKADHDVTNIYSNVIYKEIDSTAMAHASLCFSQAAVSDGHELFNIDSVTTLPKSTEQIIFEGKEIQKEILSYFERSNNFQPVTVHKMGEKYKKYRSNGFITIIQINNSRR